MPYWDRSALLLGEDGVRTLSQKRVAVFGLGGVGGHACEALARAGVGALDLFDADLVEETNRNRQLVALCSTEGQAKTEVMAGRVADINPDCHVRAHTLFYVPDNAEDYPLQAYDYVVDAVDTVAAKLELARRAHEAGVPLVSSMGAGNRLHPERFEVADIYETSVCPLARVMRRELRRLGIPALRVVYSTEPPLKAGQNTGGGTAFLAGGPGEQHERNAVVGSVSFVPGAAGLVLAGEVVRGLLGL